MPPGTGESDDDKGWIEGLRGLLIAYLDAYHDVMRKIGTIGAWFAIDFVLLSLFCSCCYSVVIPGHGVGLK